MWPTCSTGTENELSCSICSQETTHKHVTGSRSLSRKEPVDCLRYDVKCHRTKKYYKGYVPGCYPIGTRSHACQMCSKHTQSADADLIHGPTKDL